VGCTGLVIWRSTSLDAITEQLTSDPLAGFVPPDVTPPQARRQEGIRQRYSPATPILCSFPPYSHPIRPVADLNTVIPGGYLSFTGFQPVEAIGISGNHWWINGLEGKL
jgi:hypothetical protein